MTERMNWKYQEILVRYNKFPGFTAVSINVLLESMEKAKEATYIWIRKNHYGDTFEILLLSVAELNQAESHPHG